MMRQRHLAILVSAAAVMLAAVVAHAWLGTNKPAAAIEYSAGTFSAAASGGVLHDITGPTKWFNTGVSSFATITGYAHSGQSGLTQAQANARVTAIQVWGWLDTDGDGQATLNDSRVSPRRTQWVKLSELLPAIYEISPDGTVLNQSFDTITGAATVHEAIDDDPDNPNDSDYVAETTSSSGALLRMDMTTVSMGGESATEISVVVRSSQQGGGLDVFLYNPTTGESAKQNITPGISAENNTVVFNEASDAAFFPVAQSDLDSLQVRLQETGAGVNDTYIYALKAYVSYGDAGGDVVGWEVSTGAPDTTSAWADILQTDNGGTAITVAGGESWLLLVRVVNTSGDTNLMDTVSGTEQWDNGDTSDGIGSDIVGEQYIDADGNTPGTSDGRVDDDDIVWTYINESG